MFDINKRNRTGIYSFHPRGANVAFCDGTVRYFSQGADGCSLRLFTRSGNEPGNLVRWSRDE